MMRVACDLKSSRDAHSLHGGVALKEENYPTLLGQQIPK
jgi:hypothetical protein